jgi:hypothetical protein
MIKTEKQIIKCPNCESHENSLVKFTWPFNTFIHECKKCKYVIMESEWELVNPIKK